MCGAAPNWWRPTKRSAFGYASPGAGEAEQQRRAGECGRRRIVAVLVQLRMFGGIGLPHLTFGVG
jgi:hypothetical protein